MKKTKTTAAKTPSDSSSSLFLPRVRWMTAADVRRALAVEQSHRTDKEDFFTANALLKFLPSEHHYCKSVVLELRPPKGEHGSPLAVGHAQFTLRVDDLFLHNVCVHKDFVRKGYGAKLVKAVRNLPQEGGLFRALAAAVVRERDLASQLFLKAQGFRWQHTYAEWFDAPPEDGYLLIAQNI